MSPEHDAVWNAFLDFLSTDYEHLNPVQRVASLLFRYDSEVQNGGHYQSFVNLRGERAAETVRALRAVDLAAHAELLDRAIGAWSASDNSPETVEGFVEGCLDPEFVALDEAYFALEPTIHEALEQYLQQYRDEFVKIQ